MGEWTRQTQWRQGSLLSAQSAIDLGLRRENEANNFVLMAISHDCDIANENLHAEPAVEFLIGKLIDKVDGSFTRAKNARTLHLEFETPEGKKAVAFAIRNRVHVEKADLADHAPDGKWSHTSPKGPISLRWWLAARYFRSSFPDSFEARLTQSKLDQKIDKQLSPHGEAVYGIFFLVDDGAGDNRNDDELHELRAVVVYDAETEDAQIKKIKNAAEEIVAAFKSKFYDNTSGSWRKIELVSCDAVSDEVFSFANSRVFKQWRLEHRSLEDDGQVLTVESA